MTNDSRVKLELERYEQAIEKRADAVTRSNSELRLIGVPFDARSQSPGAASQPLFSDQQANDFQTRLRDLIATCRAHINERTAVCRVHLEAGRDCQAEGQGSRYLFAPYFMPL